MQRLMAIAGRIRALLPKLGLVQSQRPENSLIREVEEARRAWENSLRYFNDVTEAELIDCAIYTIGAAEHRYAYLLKKAKGELGCDRLDAG
ncbi:MAG TPA: YaaL family protein [Bacillota bacterium]|nr:YaaL family protein [Bacillota bacterium]HPT67472.1 YaaL family protein [Bacillota bacterium]